MFKSAVAYLARKELSKTRSSENFFFKYFEQFLKSNLISSKGEKTDDRPILKIETQNVNSMT